MRTTAEKIGETTVGRSAAQLAGAHHGRSAAAMAAAAEPDEEYPVQRTAGTAQMKFQALASGSPRTKPVALASAHTRRVAQLQAVVRRGAGTP